MLLGAHVSTAGGIHTAVERGAALGCDAIQIFPQSPRQWRATNHPEENLERFRALRADHELAVVCHGPYLTNLASPDDELVAKSAAALLSCLHVAAATDAVGVIFHVGSHRGAGVETGMVRATAGIGAICERMPDGPWLLIENSAGAGDLLGRQVAELGELVRRCDHPRLGICLDSAHLYATGIDVGSAGAMDALMDEVEAEVGLERLRALHVNDSATALASNRDRHANIAEGEIGERLSAFLGHPRLQGLPCVLETAGHAGEGPDAECMQNLRRLHAAGVAQRG